MENIDIETNIFDEEELHTNCTVQILHNSVTGEYSVGWWENHDWVKVDYDNPETLPDTNEDILYAAFGVTGEGEYRGFDGYHHVWKMYAVGGTHWDDEVTYWRPLPAAPDAK